MTIFKPYGKKFGEIFVAFDKHLIKFHTVKLLSWVKNRGILLADMI